MGIDMAATDENITLEIELEQAVPPSNNTSQNPSHLQPTVEPDPEINAVGRPVRKKRLTWKLLQQLPAPPSPLPEPIIAFEGIERISETLLPEVVWRSIKTTSNSFGLYCEYPNIPTHNPDNTLSILNLVDHSPPINEMELSASVSTPPSLQVRIPNSSSSNAPSFFPFKNSTIFGMMSWMWTGSSMKSIDEMKKLVDFLKSNDFQKDDLAAFDIHSETMKYDNYLERPATDYPQDGWRESEVVIQVPENFIPKTVFRHSKSLGSITDH